MYFATILFLMFLYIKQDNFQKRELVLYSSIPLVVIIFLRFGVGADYFAYQNIYNIVDISDIQGSFNQLPKIEFLFKSIIVIFKFVRIPYHVFISILSIVMLYFSIKLIEEISPNYMLSVLLYFSMIFLFWNLSAIRQGLVLSILLYVYFSPKLRLSLSKTILITVVCFFIHASAIIIPIIYIFSKLNWSRKNLFIVFLLFPITRMVIRPEFFGLFKNIPILSKILLYADYDKIKILSIPFLLRFFIFGVILIHYNQLIIKYKPKIHIINFTALSMLLYFYIPFSKLIGTRVTIFGYYLSILIFPMIVSLYKSMSKRYYYSVISVVLIFSSVQFVNEFYKQIDRTGYDKSAVQFNFETIFQKNYTHFNNRFAFEFNNQNIIVDDLSETIGSFTDRKAKIEAKPSNNSTYQVAKHANGKTLILNNKGKIVDLVSDTDNVEIISNVMRLVMEDPSYSSAVYKYVGQDVEIPYDDVIKELTNQASVQLTREIADINRIDIPIADLKKYSIFEQHNFNTLWKAAKYFDTFDNKHYYLRISTKHTNYYAILDSNENMITNKLYRKILPYNVNGISVGYTDFSKEYINSKGEVIWIEKLID